MIGLNLISTPYNCMRFQKNLIDIINSVITPGFKIKKFDEHRDWENENIQWKFTIEANK